MAVAPPTAEAAVRRRRYPVGTSPPAPDVERAWLALWASSPQQSPFAHPAYAEAMRQVVGIEYELFTLEDPEGWRGLALAFVRRLGPYRYVAVPPLTPFTSFLFSDTLAPASIHERRSGMDLLLDAIRSAYHAASFHLHPALSDVRPATWAGFRARPLYTYRARLAPAARLPDGWSKTPRRLLRKHGGDYDVRADHDPADMAALCAESYGRHGRRLPLPAPAVAALVERLGAAGLARTYVACPVREPGVPAAAVAVLTAGDTSYYWLAGSRPGPAMTVLLGRLLPDLHAEGRTLFDFVGANTPSIAEFKRKLGTALVPYFRIEAVWRPELRLARRLLR